MDAAGIKQAVGRAAVDALVRDGMKLGLGTGSTAVEAVYRVGELLRAGTLQDIKAVPTSFQTVVACQTEGISLWTLNDPVIGGALDLTIDGADEVDPQWRLIKGGGAAMLIEKIVAHASQAYCIIVDDSKIVTRLGEKAPVPVEVFPEALTTATRSLEALGGTVELRMAVRKDGPVTTDHGGFVLDVRFPHGFDPPRMEREIMAIPGVTANGIFTCPVTDLIVGAPDGSTDHRRKL
ncbi:MAG: ribose-5-phosphate isomerase RpiA [Spirochaetales bacterium]|nr:ribose-5-phosphate isomerase RpiA [Spirochaetales bacterium]